jgi:uncharacterized protein YdbL (DUF1318 family)
MTDSPDQKAATPAQGDRRPQGEYEVGYGKPPAQHRFQKGHKPKNTKRARKSHAGDDDVVSKLLATKISVRENGKAKKMTVEEAMIHGLVQKAVKGDMRAIQTVIKVRALMAKAEAERAPTEEEIREKIEQERITQEANQKFQGMICDILDDFARWKRIGIFDEGKGEFVDWIEEELLRRQHGDQVFAEQHYLEYVPYEPVGLTWKMGDPSPLDKVKGNLGNY